MSRQNISWQMLVVLSALAPFAMGASACKGGSKAACKLAKEWRQGGEEILDTVDLALASKQLNADDCVLLLSAASDLNDSGQLKKVREWAQDKGDARIFKAAKGFTRAIPQLESSLRAACRARAEGGSLSDTRFSHRTTKNMDLIENLTQASELVNGPVTIDGSTLVGAACGKKEVVEHAKKRRELSAARNRRDTLVITPPQEKPQENGHGESKNRGDAPTPRADLGDKNAKVVPDTTTGGGATAPSGSSSGTAGSTSGSGNPATGAPPPPPGNSNTCMGASGQDTCE